MRETLLTLAGIFYFLAPLDVGAMTFRIFFQPDLKLNLVVGEGEIVLGDDQRFLAMVPRSDRDEEGHVILVLDSLGGSVAAAFQLVAAMDKVGVYTIVPQNALCASACASIVYASGVRRNVVGNGKLGFHSCYLIEKGKPSESSFCNEAIAQNAVARGLDHAAVNLFVNDYGAGKMAWVDKDVGCSMLRGLCKPTLREHVTSSLAKPSFDCRGAVHFVEKMICSDSELAALDQQLFSAYMAARKLARNNEKAVQASQRTWLLSSRNGCDEKRCIVAAYKRRIGELTNAQ